MSIINIRNSVNPIQWRIQTFHLMGGGGGGHKMRLNANGTVGSFGRKLIHNKIII